MEEASPEVKARYALAKEVEMLVEQIWRVYEETPEIVGDLDPEPVMAAIETLYSAFGIEMVTCGHCTNSVPALTAHRHRGFSGGWVGDRCCWVEELRATE